MPLRGHLWKRNSATGEGFLQPKNSAVQRVMEDYTMQITKERLTKEQLLDAARSAAKYLPAASADIMNELATRLDVTGVALSESMEQRKKLKDSLSRMVSMHELMMGKVNHGASFYDGPCLAEMNEAPVQAKRALTEADFNTDEATSNG